VGNQGCVKVLKKPTHPWKSEIVKHEARNSDFVLMDFDAFLGACQGIRNLSFSPNVLRRAGFPRPNLFGLFPDRLLKDRTFPDYLIAKIRFI
jgi:hypothetical protein